MRSFSVTSANIVVSDISLNTRFAFEAPFGGLGATYDVHLMLIGKLIGDFLLVIIKLFSLGAFVLSQYTRLTDRHDRQTESRQQYRVYASQSHGKNCHIKPA